MIKEQKDGTVNKYYLLYMNILYSIFVTMSDVDNVIFLKKEKKGNELKEGKVILTVNSSLI